MSWSVQEEGNVLADFRRWHVFPSDEVVVHTLYGETCFCIPKIQRVQNYEGKFHRIVVHCSTDGREYIEDAERIKDFPDRYLPE